jgi:imidazolonepropionase-like amidohydrolase
MPRSTPRSPCLGCGAIPWPGALSALLVMSAAALGAQQTAITARRVFDGEKMRENATVVVDGNRIVSVGALPAGFRGTRYDLGESTLLPGLIDVHSHLAWYFNAKDRLHTDDDGDTPVQSALAAAGNAYATLMGGVTTLQSPGSPQDKDVRDAIARGAIPGPRVRTSLGSLSERSGTPDELRAKVRDLKAQGADLIKLFASKSIREGGGQTMTDAQLQAACGEGRAAGLRVLVHAHSADAMKAAVLAGCDQIEHGIFATDEVLRLMAEKGTYLSAQCGLIFRNYLANRKKYEGIGNYNAEGFAAMEKAMPLGIAAIRKALGTPGLRMVFGTDAVAGAHGRNVEDLICRVNEAGQPVQQALIAATSLAAKSMGLADSVGTLRAGMQADIIAVPGDLSRDAALLRRVHFVMKGGRVYRSESAGPGS